MKIGAITVGQSPRIDVTEDIMDIFNGKVELLQRGGLDGLTAEEIRELEPEKEDYVLVSRLRDGSPVTFGERYILPRLQTCIRELEAEGAGLIMFFCTGAFPDVLQSRVPLVYPCHILNRVVPLLTRRSSIAIVIPSPLQIEQGKEKWSRHVKEVKAVAASPYGSWEALLEAAGKIREMDVDLVVLDCIGYSQEMKNMFVRHTGKPVVLPRTLLARVISELTDTD